MPLPPWTIELIRRGISDVARKASEPETLEKLKTQATEILQDLPETAARGLDAVMRKAEMGKESVQRWTRKQTAIAIPMINASGVLKHPEGTGVPLSQTVIEAGYDLLRGDCLGGAGPNVKLAKKIERLLPVDGDYSIAIAGSFPAALTAFSQLVQERPLVIHRSHAVRLPGGVPLPEAFGTLLPVIQEVGSIGDVDPSDYDSFDSFCDIVADVGKDELKLLDFASRDAMQAVVLPVATVGQAIDVAIPSAESCLTQGADFVLMPGDGICGGPSCGLLIGRRSALEAITGSPAWPSLVASESVQAMMVVALETAAASADQIPVRALLDTSVENLSSRADRMTTRLAASEDVRDCQVTMDNAKLIDGGRWEVSSRQLRLRHNQLSAHDWAEKLASDVPAVIVGLEGDQVVVDLRWVDTASDNQLAKTLGGVEETVKDA
ncbi:hypothetical protein [Stieleria marina]|uniref:L-seryl-tRNA(Sec) selenium transferase n=1 Tax=Stieleria marina TaxID=1930275 RepID=A0A517NNI1_9BACT|nr:L-seryl-tRNA(Sec) selenium transferase [Planctomycetes bacterium K23_9]